MKTLDKDQELEKLLVDINAKVDKIEKNLDILGPVVVRIEQLMRGLFKSKP